MKVLMISSDPAVRGDTPTAKRIEEYGQLVDELRTVVVSGKSNVWAFCKALFDGWRILAMRNPADFIITCQDPAERWVIGFILSRAFSIPLELQIHTDLLSPFFWSESMKNKIRVLIARFLIPRASTLRVVSQRVANSLEHMFGHRLPPITILPVFVDIAPYERLQRVEGGDTFIFLMVSRFTNEKHISLALDAFAEVLRTHPIAHLMLVGEGPLRGSLVMQARTLGIEKNVTFKGWTDNLQAEYQLSDCYLLTSQYEGYGRTVIEALASGLPVIMTDVGLAEDLVQDGINGLVVPVNDSRALMEAMKRIMDDATLRARFSSVARESVSARIISSKKEYLDAFKKTWELCYKTRKERMPHVCFVLPETTEDTATHFAHKWELMQELEGKVKFFAYQPTIMGIAKMKYAYFIRGVRTFYVHYSFKGALVAFILTKVLGGTVYYWNCGMPWLYTRGWFEERIFRFILRHTILVIGTDGLADEYATRYRINRNAIRVIPNYIRISRMQSILKEEARRQLGIPLDKKVVLFLHRLSRRKGVHLLPEIIKEFGDMHDVLFVIVGEGPERQDMELRIKNYELWKNTKMVGNVSNRDIPFYFAASDIYLMPSEEEGMPNALLEAMAVGVPFVASDVAAVREMTPPGAREFILPYGKTHECANAIKKLLADEELRKALSREEQEWVKRFDVKVVAPKFLEIIQERI
ncbi:MAG: 1,2-diacylglycerol 3-glucosyltransferase [Parcubacteria group bacterium Gr01-1014_70]|nr:MAG: 1,2-diacylglycerol 3-glucosyltransferase [Parcubacteria group bacterium Gr01-1014_70]